LFLYVNILIDSLWGNGGRTMEKEINFRHWFAEHLLANSFIFALMYQAVDIFLNYFVSGELRQGFGNFYRSAGGREDLSRFLLLSLLFLVFGIFSRNIIRELKKTQADQLRNLNEIKNFAHSVVHDVKNPAIGIHTMAMLLKKKYSELLDDQGKHYFEIMEQTSEDIVALMEKVDIYIRAREYPLTFENVDVQNVIEIIREGIIPTLEVRRIEWFQQPEVFPKIRGDRLSIHRIFRNLIDNALKYGGDDLSRIILEYCEDPQFYVFCICDNGCGIDEYEKKNVFEIFARAKNSGNIEGMGLGLAIVKELVEKHGGIIQMNSALGKGTTFTFTISKNNL